MLKNKILNTKAGLTFLMVGLFAFNCIETYLENTRKSTRIVERGYGIADAFHGLEGYFSFNYPEIISYWTVVGYSFSYFILLPLLLIGTAIAFALRTSISPFRVFTLAIAINYALSLPFFIFFPVPERWAFPDANTILLSDLLSVYLIEFIRPISGLDNCFPSIHTSFTIIIIFACYHFNTRFSKTVLFLGITILFSTIILGIHWMADVMAGIAMGVLSVSFAIILDQKLAGNTKRQIVKPKRTISITPWKNLKTAITLFISKRNVPAVEPETWRSIFLSYRRENGSNMARIVQSEIIKRGYSVFLDVDDLGPNQFDEKLLKQIEKAPNFVLILAPGSLDRCINKEDWLFKEISHAIQSKSNIVPIMIDNFKYPPKESLPEEIKELVRHNSVIYSHEYFDATFDKLEVFLK
ncbi:MAG: phosphatase PAP2 family protein [Nitrospinales bacterium]